MNLLTGCWKLTPACSQQFQLSSSNWSDHLNWSSHQHISMRKFNHMVFQERDQNDQDISLGKDHFKTKHLSEHNSLCTTNTANKTWAYDISRSFLGVLHKSISRWSQNIINIKKDWLIRDNNLTQNILPVPHRVQSVRGPDLIPNVKLKNWVSKGHLKIKDHNRSPRMEKFREPINI
jgi:hypothetical protein